MSSNKKYWKSVEELKENSSIVDALKEKEFASEIPVDEFLGNKSSLEASSTSRRDFLKYVGFSTAAATLAACEGPVVKSIPYIVAPERITVGKADYYATAMADGFDFASVLVKTREGRPIKIENNKMATDVFGANARVHASVLSMYDTNRLQAPKINGEGATWAEIDEQLGSRLKEMGGKQIVLLTQTFASPSTTKLIEEFSAAYPNVRHITYDAISEDAVLDAFQSKYGMRALPDYDFSIADVIISVGADFLGDWQGGGYDVRYAKGRIPENGNMSRHVQFEANMTITGATADKRVPMTPRQQKQAVSAIHSLVTGGGSTGLSGDMDKAVRNAAKQLRDAGSKGVFVTGVPDVNAQLLALNINASLGSQVIDTASPRMTRQGNGKEVMQLVKDMNAGSVGAIMFVGVNPAYSLPDQEAFKAGLEKVDVRVSASMSEDETAQLCQYLTPTPHYLESWGDVQIKKGQLALMQPTIRPIFDTRQFQESLLRWTSNENSYYDYLKSNWISASSSFNQALQDGIVNESATTAEQPQTEAMDSMSASGGMTVASAAAALANQDNAADGSYELILYPKISMGDGRQANNPWLQEMPDPITRTTWDNYLTISKADADVLGLENEHVSNGALNGSKVNLTVGETTIKDIPVFIQPGQAKGSVGLALGYGKTAAIQKEMQVGVNAYPLYKNLKSVQTVQIEKANSGWHEFASVQLQNTMVGRGDDIIKETTLEIFNSKDVEHWNAIPGVDYNHSEISVRNENANIWESFDDSLGHHFNLSIDLNACTGCGACVIACHSENNVPVVGKEEVRKFRDMHWLRIDRYYSSAETFEQEIEDSENLPTFDSYSAIETQSYDNPEVAFQPVMCQHCNHAPCETVCPVAAIGHGRQGQNQMTYNRCVGTRYCANNCPYKVRRFNWFLYNENDEFPYNMSNDLGRMVLNPDVTVRSRGVMEKCSMCIQLTQKTILDAKRDGHAINDGEFFTACSSACDKGAIQFGDVNLANAEIVELKRRRRKYYLLEDLGVKPNVFYHVKVKNTGEA